MDKFFTQKYCDRCGTSLEGKSRTMSKYNTDCICMDCKTKEMQRIDYKEASDAENKAVKNGDYNFLGIGLK